MLGSYRSIAVVWRLAEHATHFGIQRVEFRSQRGSFAIRKRKIRRRSTLTWHLSFTSDFDCSSGFPSNLRAIAKLKKRQGTGELAGLGGRLRFDDTTYSGVLR